MKWGVGSGPMCVVAGNGLETRRALRARQFFLNGARSGGRRVAGSGLYGRAAAARSPAAAARERPLLPAQTTLVCPSTGSKRPALPARRRLMPGPAGAGAPSSSRG